MAVHRLHHLHDHHFHLLSLAQSFIMNLRLGSLANPFLHRPFPLLPYWFHGLSDHLMFLFCSTDGFVYLVIHSFHSVALKAFANLNWHLFTKWADLWHQHQSVTVYKSCDTNLDINDKRHDVGLRHTCTDLQRHRHCTVKWLIIPRWIISASMYQWVPTGFFPGVGKFIAAARIFSGGWCFFPQKKLTTFLSSPSKADKNGTNNWSTERLTVTANAQYTLQHFQRGTSAPLAHFWGRPCMYQSGQNSTLWLTNLTEQSEVTFTQR